MHSPGEPLESVSPPSRGAMGLGANPWFPWHPKGTPTFHEHGARLVSLEARSPSPSDPRGGPMAPPSSLGGENTVARSKFASNLLVLLVNLLVII